MGSKSSLRTISLSSGRFVVRPQVAHREVEGQVVILAPGDSALFTLNDSAALIWRDLVRGCEAAALAKSLQRAYGIDPVSAAKDVEGLLRDLVHRQIVARRRR